MATAGALCLATSPTAHADVTTVTVSDRAEAWYGGAPVANCTSPIGCPPVSPPTAYPANTLHVGVTGGSETARTYIALDMSAVPPGATVSAATLTLPVSPDSSAGNLNLSSALQELCLAVAPIDDGVSGSGESPPGVDCSVHVDTTYKPAPGGSTGDTFTADLAPFLAAWKAGTPDYGVAILPVPAESPTGAWHVAFNGRQATGVAHISAALTVSKPSIPAMADVSPAAAGPLTDGPALNAPNLPAPGAVNAVGSNPVVAPTLPSRTTPVADLATRRLGSVPRPVLWFPLLMLIVAGYTIRTFTRPVLEGRRYGHTR